MAAINNPAPMVNSAPMASAPRFTSTPIYMKLDDDNFLQWKDQVEALIEGNDLLDHVIGSRIPHKFLENGEINSEYQRWKKQDALLKSWLLASMTKPYMTRMVGYTPIKFGTGNYSW
ncbi:uncharacterized protein LOC127744777 [Arachis duranensis]|uniref:Uncharacterized protein LOC127744777 n=1 Tax=Arachis duranensis TaxID=130453 RepID=A0A9C6WP62_ARADU|nr:uncharacterized protein LOC127744777 [Arachis duranensis]